MKYFDDDMDELFNKAGRQYPLSTEPKNWDAVQRALLQEQGAETVQKGRDWRRLLPLLLLLLIPAVYVFIDKDNIIKENNSKETANRTGRYNNVQNNIDRGRSNISKQSFKARQATVTKEQTLRTKEPSENTKHSSDRELNHLSYVPPAKQNPGNAAKVGVESVHFKGGLSGRPQAGILEKTDRFKTITHADEINKEPAAWNNIPILNTTFTGFKEPSEAISLEIPVRALSESNVYGSVPNSAKKTKNKKGLYFGLIAAAPDLTTIKGQDIKGMGYSAGMIAGYTLNNRWQVEGGAMWSRKKYYTDGKYFSKTAAGIPPNINIHWLDGGCEMLEFPVAVKYNISAKKNTFFGSAGLTSYLMKKEDYKYSAKAGASGYDYIGYKSYKRSGDHLFANLQLSGGYKYNLSSKLNIRIEPYLKIPLKKIGIGKMPITSTGLYLVITRGVR